MLIFDVSPETRVFELINTKYLPQCVETSKKKK